MTESTKKVGAITAGLAVLLIGVWYLALFRPQSSALQTANAAYTQAEQQANTLQGQIASLQALERQVPADTAKLAQYDLAVPKTPNLQDILNQLHALAVTAGVELTSLNPAISAPGAASSGSSPGAGNQIQLSMTINGGYNGIRGFLTGLEKMPRIIVVTQLSIGGSASTLTASISAHTFYAP